MALKIHNFRHLWTVKAIIVPPATIGFFIYCMVAGRKGATTYAATTKQLHGSNLGWAFMYAVQAVIGSFSPLIASNPDIARYAKRPSATGLPQFFTIVFWKTIICMIGIFGTNAIAYKYGTTYWNMWDICNAILDKHFTGGVRFAIFVFAIIMATSEQIKNLSANLISFGADSACLLPKYLNINRGMVLGLTVGFVIQPWHILATAKSFLTFLTGYSIFLGAIPAIAVTDYILRKGNVDVFSLYTSKKGNVIHSQGIKILTVTDYWYKGGFNWKAYAGYIMAVWPVCPGLAYQFSTKNKIAPGWIHLYQIGWIFGVCVSASLYVALSYLFKDPAMFEARKHGWESYARSQKDLLDKELNLGTITVLEGSSIADSETDQQVALEKELTKAPGLVTIA
jgi:NCS1 family nucleobase:cation symporter-1